PGKGSTFTVRLPAGGAEEAAPIGLPSTTVAGGAGGTVLVIDDDQTARELMTNYLVQQGFSVVTEATGLGGLKRARELKPVAITLDIILPDVDGWTVIAALKGDPELAGIPVVIVSIVDEARRGVALGALGYLTKPIERDKLLDVLERFRGQNRQPSVLVVEDDVAQRELARSILAAQGWLVQ